MATEFCGERGYTSVKLKGAWKGDTPMIRKIIHIDQDKCNGCGACAAACHEGAIGMVDGKARLLRDDYCYGLGDCLPACPTGASPLWSGRQRSMTGPPLKKTSGRRRAIWVIRVSPSSAAARAAGCGPWGTKKRPRRLPAPLVRRPLSWASGRQIKLVPVNAPYFQGAKLLIAADCTAYAYANMHSQFMRGKITLIGCPKLDSVDYSEKLTQIIRDNDIQSVTVVRMEVPCCGGLEMAAKTALQNSGKFIPWQVVTISIDGQILD